MHFGDFKDTTDKIVHLLVAAICEGMYDKAINECSGEYGIDATNIAVAVFKKDYDSLIKRLN